MDEDPRYLEAVAASMQGRRRTMDSSSLSNILPQPESNESGLRSRGPTGVFGVFDGTRGSLASFHCQNSFLNLLKNAPGFETTIETALASACITLHHSVKDLISSTHSTSTAGTAIVCIRDGHLYSVEASGRAKQVRSMLLRADNEIVWLDNDEPPVIPTSTPRPARKGQSCRRNADIGVDRPVADGDEGIQVQVIGLDYEDEFVITATAGLWSVITGPVAVKIVKTEMHTHGDLARAAQKLVYAAFVNNSTTNIVVQVILLNSKATIGARPTHRWLDRDDAQKYASMFRRVPRNSRDWEEETDTATKTKSGRLLRFGKSSKDTVLTPSGRRSAPKAVYGPGKKTTTVRLHVSDGSNIVSPKVPGRVASRRSVEQTEGHPAFPPSALNFKMPPRGPKVTSRTVSEARISGTEIDKSGLEKLPRSSISMDPRLSRDAESRTSPEESNLGGEKELVSSSTVTDQWDNAELDAPLESASMVASTPAWMKNPRPASPTEGSSIGTGSVELEDRPKTGSTDISSAFQVRLNFRDIRKASSPSLARTSTEYRENVATGRRTMSGLQQMAVGGREEALMSLSTEELGLLMENYARTYQYEEAARIRNVIVRKTSDVETDSDFP